MSQLTRVPVSLYETTFYESYGNMGFPRSASQKHLHKRNTFFYTRICSLLLIFTYCIDLKRLGMGITMGMQLVKQVVLFKLFNQYVNLFSQCEAFVNARTERKIIKFYHCSQQGHI